MPSKVKLAVSFEAMAKKAGEGFELLPYCKMVLKACKRRGAEIILFTDLDYHHAPLSVARTYSNNGSLSLESVSRFLAEKEVPVDRVCRTKVHDLEYDLLVCGRAGFSGDWQQLGIELQVLRLEWRVYIARCLNGALRVGYTNDVDTTEKELRSGYGPKWVRLKFREMAWRSKVMRKRDAKRMCRYIKGLSPRVRRDIVDGKKKVRSRQREDGRKKYAVVKP